MSLKLGMPSLLETKSIEAYAVLCKEQGLDLIEINMNLLEYQVDKLDIKYLYDISYRYGIYYIIHLADNLNPCDFNEKVAYAYTETVLQTIEIAKLLKVKILKMQLPTGGSITLPDKRVYLFDVYEEYYLEKLAVFRDVCETAIGNADIKICVQTIDDIGSKRFIRKGLDVLLQSPVFTLDFDVVNNAKSNHIDNAPIDNNSTNDEKVDLFYSLFQGRRDVYARRWENSQKSGYTPVCSNEWIPVVCEKPKMKCANCRYRKLVPFDKQVVVRHLSGNEVAGIYPMLPDETCHFLAIDFDDEGWQGDVSAVITICKEKQIPIAVERSRSGNGAHIWIFFGEPIPATLARKLGSAILTTAMEQRPEIKFKSYDRLFPNQDTMPKGGFGNLIALPLQRNPRNNGNSVFIDEYCVQYIDQWAFLSSLKRLTLSEVENYVAILSKNGILGNLYSADDEPTQEPWQKKTPEPNLSKTDFPFHIRIVEANMIYIEKKGISARALNKLKRLAAFQNPEFYKAQAMRFPTYTIPRIISIADETDKYLCLPRGCKDEVVKMLENNVEISWQDERCKGKFIDVIFNGTLRDEQTDALEKLLAFENGILSATTAFGKTVVSAALIAARKVTTLILVNRLPLLDQWKKRLSEFLTINETLPELEIKRGRKKELHIIGQLGGGKNTLNGVIDIAIIQSVSQGNEVKDIVKNYGMVIVDECHHIPALSFERVIKEVNARYVYGLTATPKRQDGHQPIIYMHCGQIRYKDDAKKQAQNRPFQHFVIPRFTSFRTPIERDETTIAIQDLFNELCQNEARNTLIISDVMDAVSEGRNVLVLTERKSHIELLANALREKLNEVSVLVGGRSKKEQQQMLDTINNIPPSQPLVIIATGKYVGEGFDVPRLDTLFLAMPFTWQGTLAQYAGRLHRLYDGKQEVQVYDYVDIHIPVLDRMYAKRVKGYAAIGYSTKSDVKVPNTGDIIFDNKSFLSVFTADISSAKREIVIVSPFVTKTRTLKMIEFLKVKSTDADVIVVTRPVSDYKESDQTQIKQILDTIRCYNISIIELSKIHQKFAVIDGHIAWYGSINLLSFGSSEESIMRLESKGIASELLRILHRQ